MLYLINMLKVIVYDIETFSTIKCVPYAKCIYKLSKISGKYYRDISEKDYQKGLNDCIVFKGLENINKMLDYVLQYKGEPKRMNNKVVKYNLYLIAHKGSGFDSYVVLNNLPLWRTVNLIKNGSGIVSLKIFNGYVDQNKKIPQYVHLRCGLLHIKDSLKKPLQLITITGKVINYNHVYLNKNWNTMKFSKIIGKKKKMNGCLILKTMCYRQHSVMLDIQKEWKN